MDAISYAAHGMHHGFDFQLGEMVDLDRNNREVVLGEMRDDDGVEILSERRISYDLLVLALGSVSNDFGTQGVAEHCIFLDRPEQAERFHLKLLNKFQQLSQGQSDKVRVAIVGAGATGVELSAELFNAVKQVRQYGFQQISKDDLEVTLIEAGESILPALPERISTAAHETLESLGTDVRVDTMVTEATDTGLTTKSGEQIAADLMVWAAGIKAPEFVADLGGLETNRLNQIQVNEFLQTRSDPNIFALGDCVEFIQADGSRVPPRAQAAHQMATSVYKNILRQLDDKPLKPYQYKDYGSLVSLSRYSTVGSLMGNLMKGSMMIEGIIARFVYLSLYRMHQVALHGYIRTALIALVGKINQALRPSLKLH